MQTYRRDSIGEKAKHSLVTPWVILLGAIGLYTGQRSKPKGDRPDSVVPYLAGALAALIGIKRWADASKRERLRFVKAYNAAAGSTYLVGHPKMQAL